MRNNPSLERCSVCDHFNYEEQIREFVFSPRTGEPICDQCLYVIKDNLSEFVAPLMSEPTPSPNLWPTAGELREYEKEIEDLNITDLWLLLE